MRIDTLRRCCRKIPGLRDQFLRLLRGEMDSCRYCLEGSDGEALISCRYCLEGLTGEEKRQAELRRERLLLNKYLEEEDYTGAAAVKENIAALMSAETKRVDKQNEEAEKRRRHAK